MKRKEKKEIVYYKEIITRASRAQQKRSWGEDKENKEKSGTGDLAESAQNGASDRSTPTTCSVFPPLSRLCSNGAGISPGTTLYDRMLIHKQRGFTNPAPKVRFMINPPSHVH